MVMKAGSGHIGTSFSCLDLLSWLHLEVLREGDRYFSSKGHDAPALYAVLIGLGSLDAGYLHRLRRLGGLPGHPDVLAVPEVVTNTGSLGMGISKARGFALADRLAGRCGDVYVLTGDGELQEGQFWESLQATANRALGEITVVVDHNKLQSDTWVAHVSDLGGIERKVEAFGWAVARCDGHDVASFACTLDTLRDAAADRPKLIVADTVKGKGVSFMEPHELPATDEALYGFHSGAPTLEQYERAAEELVVRLDARLARLGAAPLQLDQAEVVRRPAPPAHAQRLVRAYGAALAARAERDERIVALDGDLRLDTGLVEFQARFPERFVECGIAEQDMVSQAGAMALAGLVPVCHSFASFLTARAAEQIFNNATEGTKVIYHGSLAGVVPGGPGHSHQMIRDVALMASVPGMSVAEPYCEEEVEQLLDWALSEASGPVYLRLVTPPWDLGFEPRVEFGPGRGTVLRRGAAGTFVCTGPVLVSQAWAACDLLGDWGLVALPWLRDVDGAWLAGVTDGTIVALDNHVRAGGQGEAILAALAEGTSESSRCVHMLAVEGIPCCGTDAEVLRFHGLDATSIAARVRALQR